MHLLLMYKDGCTGSLLLYQNSKCQERIKTHSDKSLPEKKKSIKILNYHKPDLKKKKSFSQDQLYRLLHSCALQILILFYNTGCIL